jgi:hypothetical protein
LIIGCRDAVGCGECFTDVALVGNHNAIALRSRHLLGHRLEQRKPKRSLQSPEPLQTRKAALLITKLDRLARNVYFISGLMESGVEFVAVDMPEANRRHMV